MLTFSSSIFGVTHFQMALKKLDYLSAAFK